MKTTGKITKIFLSVLLISFLIFPLYLDRYTGKFIIKSVEHKKKEKECNGLINFLIKLRQSESNGDYEIINQYHFLGAYQIGRTALKEIGMDGVPDSIFLKTPDLQEVAVRKLLKKNKEYIIQYIKKYDGQTICDVLITESGLIAAAYGTGAGSVIKFLESNGEFDPADGNGIQTSFLIKKYGGYALGL